MGYIDINGPNNCVSCDPEFLKKDPPFDLKNAFFAPGVIHYIVKLMEILGLTMEQVEERFLTVAADTKDLLQLKVEEKIAWRKLKKEF